MTHEDAFAEIDRLCAVISAGRDPVLAATLLVDRAGVLIARREAAEASGAALDHFRQMATDLLIAVERTEARLPRSGQDAGNVIPFRRSDARCPG
ncbi:MAG: hypothetical protein VYD87_10955 [Pseudomonadota bacterium]|nr:hypothetical protein [Pseudomonadota bacterium]MEE3101984.1 hypothetical protein [Pseudomonadota bacterium]